MKRAKGGNGKSSHLTREDGILWKRVAETTTPLHPSRERHLQQELQRLMQETAPASQTTSVKPSIAQALSFKADTDIRKPVRGSQNLQNHPLEQRLLKKLARGRQTIDARIDLHGMTQDRARFALLDFLQMAQRADHRIVLVITGKGSEGRGVLRRNVPEWLKLPQFAACVNGVQTAHVSHGGEGALYVRVRKPTKRTSGQTR